MKTINWNEALKDATHHGKNIYGEFFYLVDGDSVWRVYGGAWAPSFLCSAEIKENTREGWYFTPRPKVKPAYTFTSGQDVFIAQINTLAGVESQRYYIKESWCACGHQAEYEDLGLLFHTKEEAESKCRALVGLPPRELPVKLVDGECYQFEYEGSSAVGFAFEGATFVARKDGECQGVSMSDCTNIQPLTVEEK